MPLAEKHRILMYELYGCTPQKEVWSVPGGGGSLIPASFSVTESLVDRVNEAFEYISARDDWTARVTAILDEYESISLDPSKINRDGYEFSLKRSLDHLRELLRPYTGIYMGQGSGGNTTPMG